MTAEQQLQSLRIRIVALKDAAEMSLAAVAMLERNVRELVQQMHRVHNELQGAK